MRFKIRKRGKSAFIPTFFSEVVLDTPVDELVVSMTTANGTVLKMLKINLKQGDLALSVLKPIVFFPKKRTPKRKK